MRKTIVFTPLVSILAIGGLSGLSAQDTSSAVLAGRVTSQDDQPLQGVNVLVESPSLLGTRQAVTDSGGQFRVYLLPNGEYTITYRLNGYLTRKLTMRLVAGQTSNASTKLTSINVQEATVEITTARNAQVDKTDTVVQTSFTSEYLEAITGRGLAALGRLAPGISTNDLTTSGNLRIRGGTGHSTKALVDGMTVTEQYRGYIANTFNMSDLIESVSVIQSPINSRYGNSDGGIITMVTSKGSNTFTGTLRVNVSRNNWGVNNYTNYPRRDGTIENPTGWRTTDDLTRSYEVTIKGPIWKDRITFAYGANLTPTTYSSRNAYIRWFDNGDGTFGRPEDSVGTYFMQTNPSLPGYGDVIRKA
ncbi:MAG: TonB-dependent receptor, partial [Holophagales bacterium]|nr:TonB-dependent receptor [Holophagales bacterium]